MPEKARSAVGNGLYMLIIAFGQDQLQADPRQIGDAQPFDQRKSSCRCGDDRRKPESGGAHLDRVG